MTRKPTGPLRRGWTTGACATAATKAALMALWGGGFPDQVSITLPKGETPDFTLEFTDTGMDWAEVGIIKDAGDDPDVTHGALIRVRASKGTSGVTFHAGEGVGTVTKAGLPIGVGEPAINPVPRQMMAAIVEEMAAQFGKAANIAITITIPNGAEIAKRTWNPRLGIVGGLSVLGTTGIVRPFSCSAWIASIHRGVDVARADGQTHVAGCTGSTSEVAVQAHYDLPDHAMLDMGDFAGGLLKYLRKHPVERVTIAGGIGKMTKLAQGAVDLHSGRSQVDFEILAKWLDDPKVIHMNSALEVYELKGKLFSDIVANRALTQVKKMFSSQEISADIIVIDRAGTIIAKAGA